MRVKDLYGWSKDGLYQKLSFPQAKPKDKPIDEIARQIRDVWQVAIFEVLPPDSGYYVIWTHDRKPRFFADLDTALVSVELKL